MPVPLAPIVLGAVVTGAVSFLKWAITRLGLVLINYAILNTIFEYVFGEVKSMLLGLPADILGMLGILKIDMGLNFIISCYIAALTMGSIRRLGFK